MRSAKASIARPSSVVKNSQGPSFAAAGGLPPFGSHGSAPEIVLAVVLRELVAIRRAAVDRRRDLREATGPNRVSTVYSRVGFFRQLNQYTPLRRRNLGKTSNGRLEKRTSLDEVSMSQKCTNIDVFLGAGADDVPNVSAAMCKLPL
jgi:hypothetical protein